MAALPRVVLRSGREKKIRSAYPWVQREEVVRADECEPGALAELRTQSSEFLAVGTYNGTSRFPFRVLTLAEEPIDAGWFEVRLQECRLKRRSIAGTNAMREVFSEADGLPGLIVDRYDRTAVVQVRSAGMERLKPMWLGPLVRTLEVDAVYERSEMEGRKEEGLPQVAGILHGELPASVQMQEGGLNFDVPVAGGLKTGFYLDQRDTRRRLRERVLDGDRVLDAFCYSGAFSLYAAQAGAICIGVDLSDVAIETARANAAHNRLESRCEFEQANAFEFLAESPREDLYDWIVLDPPAIAKQQDKRSSLKWGIWKLVYHAIDHLKPGGRMIVCSCSYQLGLPEMLDTIRLAASDRGRRVFLEETTIQSPDHPYLLQFPESLYLKCAWVRFEPMQ